MIRAKPFNPDKIVHFKIEMIAPTLTYKGFRSCLTCTMAEAQG